MKPEAKARHVTTKIVLVRRHDRLFQIYKGKTKEVQDLTKKMRKAKGEERRATEQKLYSEA